MASSDANSSAPPGIARSTLSRSRPSFLARAAVDTTERLQRRSSPSPANCLARPTQPAVAEEEEEEEGGGGGGRGGGEEEEEQTKPYKSHKDTPAPVSGGKPAFTQLFRHILPWKDETACRPTNRRSRSGRRKSSRIAGANNDVPRSGPNATGLRRHTKSEIPKVGSLPRPTGGSEKLGTFSGVFVPTVLNVLSILMFIRFGFILGQTGVVGTMGMMVLAYSINLVTTMSISAVASNGRVRGGGAYYLISRSLGPEFGGSIGIVFYMGFVFNTGLNAVGLVDCLIYNFGSQSGQWSHTLPQGFWWQYLWATGVLLLCTAVCLAGSSIFARCSTGLVAILMIATLSIPFSAIVVKPYHDPINHVNFTGLSTKTLKENLMPHFTRHAVGSQLKTRENFQDLFGVLFPATGGIFAGASMSGDLKNPSTSIPKGTLYGLALTFVSYTLVVFAMAASVSRASLYNNLNVIQDTNVSGVLILLGEFATTFFSALMGVIGPAKLLQAIARDSLLPGLSIFGQGTRNGDEPTRAIIATFIVAQLTMLFDINRIASFITMTYLMTFLVTNLACFLLTISAAPNFRPSFRYFNWWTAAAGTLACAVTMFAVDGVSATGAVGILMVIFLLIHYTTPPKPWGDVSQSLIYHQVRKYLLRLKEEHVKFWRPQILLLVNDPRRGYKLIQFCNSLKKGALFVLGHVIVTNNFGASVPEARRQQAAWAKYIDFSKIKAFINVVISPSIEWGARNVVLSAGLGGMRPNIVVMGLYNLKQFREDQPLVDVPSPPPERRPRKHSKATGGLRKRHSTATKQLEGALPTDQCNIEKQTDVQSYLMVLEDMLLKLHINVAVASGFNDLELPNPSDGNTKKYIDLWPIQMSATMPSDSLEETGQDVMTTNFDTYTLILQLGCILNTVPSWKKSYSLRVAVFVEYESDVEEERARVATLLENLRIRAEILVFWLASGDVKSYQMVVNGNYSTADAEIEEQVEKVLEDGLWWTELKRHRGRLTDGDLTAMESPAVAGNLNDAMPAWPSVSFENGRREQSIVQFEGVRRLLTDARRQQSVANLSNLGVSVGMRTHSLNNRLMNRHMNLTSDSEGSRWSDEESFDSNSAVEGSDEDLSSEGIPGENNSAEESDSWDESPMNTFIGDKSASISKASSKSENGRKRGTAGARATSRPRGLHPKSKTKEHDSTLVDTNSSGSLSPMQVPTSPQIQEQDLLDSYDAEPTLQLSQPEPCGRFSSSPLPLTKVATEEGPGPSIMFAAGDEWQHPTPQSKAPTNDTTLSPNALQPTSTRDSQTSASASRNTSKRPSPSNRHSSTTASFSTALPAPASASAKSPFSSPSSSPAATKSSPQQQRRRPETPKATPKATTTAAALAAASIPLSFNDLPCRAQHLILNELITRHSEDTAVVFTTLPAPVEGTYRTETESLAYVSDLEVLCGGLPPTLLVHSNSMTVTMNL